MTHDLSLSRAATAPEPKSSHSVYTLLQTLWQTNWPLTLTGLASAALLAATAALALVDPRVIAGAPAWFKPMKFSISIAFYALTLVWMLGHVRGHPQLVGIIGSAVALGMTIEMGWVLMQAMRGVRSHFNLSTPFDANAYSLMGLIILVIWLLTALTALLLMRQKLADPVFAWSLRLGLLVGLAGMSVGFLMTGRLSPAQTAEIETQDTLHYAGTHSVGVEDGGPGLPFVGWSTEGGDLRVPHFIGLHGLQLLPLAGLAINRRFAAALSLRRRAALLWTAGLGYLGLFGLSTWQALRGQPVAAPDSLTLGLLAGLVVTLLVSGLLIVQAKRSPQIAAP
jgi:hypothetical protein